MLRKTLLTTTMLSLGAATQAQTVTVTGGGNALQQAINSAAAGSTIVVGSGTYNPVTVNTAGLTIEAASGTTPVINVPQSDSYGVNVEANNVTVSGLTINGDAQSLTLAQANTLGNTSATTANGINIGYVGGPVITHTTIANNTVTNMPGGGIQANYADYVTIKNNVVSGNANYSPYGESGISLYALQNSDNNTGTKNVISGNTVYNNKELVGETGCGGAICDGEGIIIDDNSNSQTNGKQYTGTTLVQGNTVYGNGSEGIQVGNSSNVTVASNDVYGNNTVINSGGNQIATPNSTGVTLASNISTPGTASVGQTTTTTQPTTPAVTVPAAAAAVGYNTQTFGPTMVLGQTWFDFAFDGNNPAQSGASQSGNTIVISGQGGDNSYNAQISSATPSGGGATFGGGGYFEATLSFTGSPSTASGWPSFWANTFEGMTGQNNHNIEVDAVEFDTEWAGLSYGSGIHDWSGGSGQQIGTSGNSPSVIQADTDLSQPHKYAFLWVPVKNGTQGYIKWFFDGNQVGTTDYWSEGGTYSAIDAQHLALILGTGPNNPMTVYGVSVWQGSGIPVAAQSTTTAAADRCAATPNGAATGGFTTANGQIYDPNGKPFIAKGIGVMEGNQPSADTLKSIIPSINFVRLAIYDFSSASSLSSYVTSLTSAGIVVEIEDHSSSDGQNRGGGTGSVFSGALLQKELAWYGDIAKTFKSNPMVWFGTNNEPPEVPSAAALSTWQGQTYQAIRSTGNTSPIMVEMNSYSPPSTGQGYTPSVYASMTNIVWDIHYYGWLSGYSTDSAKVAQTLNGMVAQAQTLKSADGTVPVIIGEYGNSTNGTTVDPNGSQVLTAVQSSGLGSAAWGWMGGPADGLTSDGNGLSSYGQEVASYIALVANAAASVWANPCQTTNTSAGSTTIVAQTDASTSTNTQTTSVESTPPIASPEVTAAEDTASQGMAITQQQLDALQPQIERINVHIQALREQIAAGHAK